MSTLPKTNSSSQRFAWLTPLQAQNTSSGPWILCENSTHHLPDCERSTVTVTVDALLRLMAAVFFESNGNAIAIEEMPDCFQSDCHRFEIRRKLQDKDNTSLFVQQRSDYFQRLELFIDNRLVAAYSEPVWPHLQGPHALGYNHMAIPVDCMEFLEGKATENSQTQPAQRSANQTIHHQDDNAAAA